MTTTTPTSPAHVRQVTSARRKALLWGALALLAFFVLFASVLANASRPWFVAVDQGWHDAVISLRNAPLNAFEIGVDIATGGPIGGSVIMLVPIIVLLIMRHWWAALYYGLGTLVAATFSQVAKVLVARERPTTGLWHVDFGSFPSGHLTGFAFFVIAVCILASRRWVTIAGIVLLIHEIFNRTYLGAHWLSDTLAGLTLGATVALLLWAAFSPRVLRQRKTRRSTAG